MTDGDLTRLGELIDSKLQPLREDIRGVKEDLSGVKEDLSGVKATQEDHTKRLEALAGDTEQIMLDIKGIRDADGMFHARNKREIDDIKKHLHLPIIPDRPEV